MPGKQRLTKAQLAERQAESWDLYVKGWTQAEIGEKFGLTQATVSLYLTAYRKSIPSQTREQLIEKHQAGLAWATKRLRELHELEAPPITAGKDGEIVRDPTRIDPTTGSATIVRDYSLQRQTALDLVRLQEREAKLAGLDAAAKVEHSGEVAIVDSVNAELARLADQLGIGGPVEVATSNADGLS